MTRPFAGAADTFARQLFTAGLDLDALAAGLEAQTAGDAILQECDVLVLEFHHLVTVRANEVVMLRFLQEIGVVVGLVTAQIDFA